MTREEYNELRLAAEHCDDYGVYLKEIAEIERKARQAGIIRSPARCQGKSVTPIKRRPTGRVRARDARHAVQLILGGKHHD